MITAKLEAYGIALVVMILCCVGAYFKGRLDVERSITTQQQAANARALQSAADAATARAGADDQARQRAADFIKTVDQGLEAVRAKFANLPTVVVDGRGCPQLTDAARDRWNAVELIPSQEAADAK